MRELLALHKKGFDEQLELYKGRGKGFFRQEHSGELGSVYEMNSEKKQIDLSPEEKEVLADLLQTHGKSKKADGVLSDDNAKRIADILFGTSLRTAKRAHRAYCPEEYDDDQPPDTAPVLPPPPPTQIADLAAVSQLLHGGSSGQAATARHKEELESESQGLLRDGGGKTRAPASAVADGGCCSFGEPGKRDSCFRTRNNFEHAGSAAMRDPETITTTATAGSASTVLLKTRATLDDDGDKAAATAAARTKPMAVPEECMNSANSTTVHGRVSSTVSTEAKDVGGNGVNKGANAVGIGVRSGTASAMATEAFCALEAVPRMEDGPSTADDETRESDGGPGGDQDKVVTEPLPTVCERVSDEKRGSAAERETASDVKRLVFSSRFVRSLHLSI